MADPAKTVLPEKRRTKITDEKKEMGFRGKKPGELLNWHCPCTALVLKDKVQDQIPEESGTLKTL